MAFKIKKKLIPLAFKLIVICSFSLLLTAWTDEEFYGKDDIHTALHEAVWAENKLIVDIILKDNRSTPEFINRQIYNNGRTALHLAALRQNTEIYQLLIYAGADTSIIDEIGQTPLSYFNDFRTRSALHAHTRKRANTN